MHLLGWHIEACGHLRDVGVDGLGPAINVILGPNESGKSTTHWFLRGVLFGFPDARSTSGRRYRPAGPTLGGRVTLEHHGQVLVARRSGRTLGLSDASGAPVTDRTLDEVTGGATRELYDAVFALDLDSLTLAGLDDRAVQEKIFAAAISGGGRSARSALGELDDRASTLLKPRSGVLRDLVRALRDAEVALGSAQAQAARLPELVAEAEAAHREVTAADDALRGARTRADWLHRLLVHWEQHADTGRLRQELEGLPELHLGPDPLGAMARERQVVDRATEQVARVQGELAAVEAQRAGLTVDEVVVGLAPRIDVAHAELVGLTERRSHHTERQVRLAATRAQLASQCEQLLGPGWDLEGVRAADVSVVARRRLEDAATRRRATRQRVQQAERAHDVASVAVAQLTVPGSDELVADDVAALGLAPDADLAAVHRDLRWLGRSLPELRAARRVEVHEQERADERRLLEALAGGRPSPYPSWMVPVLGAAAAAMTVVAGISLLGGEVVAGVLSVLVALGAVAVLIAVRRSVLAGSSGGFTSAPPSGAADGAEVAGGDRQSESSSSQALAAQVTAVALRCGLTGEPRDDEVAAREEAVAALVARAAQAAQNAVERQRAERRASDAADELAIVRRADEQALERWQSVVAELALPGSLPTEGFEGVVTQIDGLRRSADDLDTMAQAHAVEQSALHAIAISHEQLLADAGEPTTPATRGPVAEVALDDAERDEGIVALHQRLQADRDTRARLDALTEQSQALGLELAAARRALANAESAVADRLAQAGAADQTAFEAVVGRVARRAEIEALLESEQTARRGAFGVGDPCERAAAELSTADPAAWADEHMTLTATLAELADAHERAVRHSQDVDTRLRDAQESAAVADRAAEVEHLRVEAAEAARSWCELTLARTAIDRTLADFERERQPAVVREAAEIFGRATGRRWSSVVPVEGGLHVQEPDGMRLGSDLLSRGATDQLYLAMRLALACSHARQAEPLPMLLDDVLVNADDTRRRALARELAAVSDTLQLIVFTASARHAELLAATRSDSTIIELDAGHGPRRDDRRTSVRSAGQRQEIGQSTG